MDAIKYSDAGHSGHSSQSSSDPIEMDTLEDLSTVPGLHHYTHPKHEILPQDEHEDEDDDDSGDEDEGDVSLLRPRERPQSRERSLSPGRKATVWKQVQRIVIEVFVPQAQLMPTLY